MDELLSLLDDDFENITDSLPIEQPNKSQSRLQEIDLNLFVNSDDSQKQINISKTSTDEPFFPIGDDSSDEECINNPTVSKYSEYGQGIKNILHSQIKQQPQQRETNGSNSQWKKLPHAAKIPKLGEEKTDAFAGIAIKNPVVSSVEMKERMTGRRLISMSLISMNMRGGDIEGDWVTVGVIVKKNDQRKSVKGSTYSIWSMSDLKDCNKMVSLFLFGKTNEQHWKTSVGSVIGILNPSIMPNKDSYKGNDTSLSVDNPQKLLLMGTSRDFGICKGRRKDGAACTMFINRSVCEFCQYHVTKEYHKSSNKRPELQAGFSNGEPRGFKKKLFEKQGIFYGGQYFCPSREAEKLGKSTKPKSKTPNISGAGEKLQKKAIALADDVRKQANASLSAIKDTELDSMGKHAIGITAGSRNLFQHLNKESNVLGSSPKPRLQSISAKQLLTMHANLKKKDDITKKIIQHTPMPVIGKGLAPGNVLDLSYTISTPNSVMGKAKLRALQKIRSGNTVIEKKDPNFVPVSKGSSEFQERIKKRLRSSDNEEIDQNETKKCKGQKMSKEEFEKLLKRKSTHENLVAEHDTEQQNNYFGWMEKREQMENKMGTTMEISCKAVSCKTCKYTAQSALERCRKEGHSLIVSNAMKRFFMCKQCKKRTCSFSKLPTKPCSGCGERNFIRVPMMQERKGPKLESETLSIRGNEINSLNSAAYVKNANIDL
ncbi:hypothetical protein CHUAL_005412 [Chamberlinius hualienensis]